MNKEKCLYSFAITVFIMGTIFLAVDFFKLDFEIILDGEKVNELIGCDDLWNYNISFIPCMWEGISGIPKESINWTKSPEENCEFFNGTFIGFNLKSEQLARERYEAVMPKCSEITEKDIDEEWLNDNCICEDCEGTFDTVYNDYVTCDIKCSKYKCADNLFINIK